MGESGTLFPFRDPGPAVPLGDSVTVRTPSTIGNFGPGFDVMSLAITWGGDAVTATPGDVDRLTVAGTGTGRIPLEWTHNCASQAYQYLRDRFGNDDPVHLHIEKGAPPGSGLGSSASSSAAGALAFAKRHRDVTEWDPLLLVEAAAHGESRVAGAHGDDVSAAVQGGLALVRAAEVRRIMPPADLHVAIVRPELELETRLMRQAVPGQLPVADVTHNLAHVAFLIDAMHRGDTASLGRCLEDRLAAPGRRVHLPFYDAVHEAARAAGATGCAISGSGPAMFAIAQDLSAARDLAGAMTDAVRATGLDAEAIACPAERRVVWQDELSA